MAFFPHKVVCKSDSEPNSPMDTGCHHNDMPQPFMLADLCQQNDGCMRFTISRHPCDMLDMLNGFRQTGKLCDIILRADSDTFAAHRVVLAAASPYFKAMFCNNMVECGMTEVPLRGVRACVLSAIIEFAYTSKVSIANRLYGNRAGYFNLSIIFVFICAMFRFIFRFILVHSYELPLLPI